MKKTDKTKAGRGPKNIKGRRPIILPVEAERAMRIFIGFEMLATAITGKPLGQLLSEIAKEKPESMDHLITIEKVENENSYISFVLLHIVAELNIPMETYKKAIKLFSLEDYGDNGTSIS